MTLHVYNDIEQRSEEWFAARRGIVTASIVGKLITVGSPGALDYACRKCAAPANAPCISLTKKAPTPIKTVHDERTAQAEFMSVNVPPVISVADNDTSRAITATLAAERIAGFTEETPMNSDMWRGVQGEPFARDHYSGHYQQAVECGFMRRDEDGWSLGLSPDGLVADDGGVEIKCPRTKTHVLWTLADKVPAQHMAQVQAALMVSGRAWWDFASYCGGLPLFVKRVTPDPVWFAAIEAACRAFEENAARIVADYHAKTNGLPKTDRLSFDLDIQVA